VLKTKKKKGEVWRGKKNFSPFYNQSQSKVFFYKKDKVSELEREKGKEKRLERERAPP
jgi:hypothetical protein